MRRFLFIILATSTLSGCSQFLALTEPKAKIEQAVPLKESDQWWRMLNDPVLNEMADILIRENIDIKIAQARLLEASALESVADNNLLPNSKVEGSSSRGNTTFPKPLTLSQISIQTAWEVDLFGRIRSDMDSKEAKRIAEEAGVDDARAIVIAELAKTIAEHRKALATIDMLNTLIAQQDIRIAALGERVKIGTIDATELSRARALRADTVSQRETADVLSKTTTYQMQRLLNVDAARIEALLKSVKAEDVITVPTPETLTAIDADTIKERPDVRVARATMLAAQADLASIEAELWPRISLSNLFGVQEGTIPFGTPANPIWSIGAALSAPIFDFGALYQRINASDARAKQQMLAYENTVNRAVEDARTATADYLASMNTLSEQRQALAERKEALRIADEQMKQGLVDVISITTAQTEYNQAAVAAINAQASAVIAYTRLQKALGRAS